MRYVEPKPEDTQSIMTRTPQRSRAGKHRTSTPCALIMPPSAPRRLWLHPAVCRGTLERPGSYPGRPIPAPLGCKSQKLAGAKAEPQVNEEPQPAARKNPKLMENLLCRPREVDDRWPRRARKVRPSWEGPDSGRHCQQPTETQEKRLLLPPSQRKPFSSTKKRKG